MSDQPITDDILARFRSRLANDDSLSGRTVTTLRDRCDGPDFGDDRDVLTELTGLNDE
jgi:hypothetical protein